MFRLREITSSFNIVYHYTQQADETSVGMSVVYRPLGYERVYLPLHKVADTPFHIQGGDIFILVRKHLCPILWQL